ncbi:hypothetical protein AMTR_s00083p00020760 [Amborella trichopoda]|uniref:Uncharacterized protein n=1 Tax=Amborella trichopoda TaxID=13333 RepID=W1P4I6_AMBTC|nr:hypothetical protein AMTR_s00083p00020760 [Amborella trichopoda]
MHYPKAPGGSLEVWTDLDICMAWNTCLLPHGHNRRDGRAGRRLIPPFSIIFCLDHHPAEWQKLVMPHLLSGDEDGRILLSLKKKMRSFFDNLEVIFGWGEGGVVPPQEEELAPASNARPEGKTPRPLDFVKPKSAPPKEREDKSPNSPSTLSSLGPVVASRSVDSWPGWSSAPLLDPGRSSRGSASRIEVGVTSSTSTHVASLARSVASVLPTPKATQMVVGSSRVHPSGSPTA